MYNLGHKTIPQVAEELGIGHSTLSRWLTESSNLDEKSFKFKDNSE